MEVEEIQQQIDEVPFWFHSIDVGGGVVTPGVKSREQLERELASLRLPDCKDRSVLDIGAWDGFFSFEAERRGARRVVALDHYVWGMDLPAQADYAAACHARGKVPVEQTRVPGLWHPGRLPGKKGFDTAHRVLGSDVEQVVGDFQAMPAEEIGAFDIVLFLGVLYHLPNPMQALRKLALLTREVAILETASIHVPGHEDHALVEFYGQNELANDPSNWWAPNAKALTDMLVAAGFRRAEIVAGGPSGAADAGLEHGRLVAHAYA